MIPQGIFQKEKMILYGTTIVRVIPAPGESNEKDRV
jgi:hypothetical protein